MSRPCRPSRLKGMDTAIVIGGGPAGLIAASHLADAGLRTTLLESRARLGGRAASDTRDGFVLNQGPHALYVGGPGMRELRGLGVDPPRWNPVSLRSVLLRGGRPRRLVGGWPAIVRLMRAPAPPSMSVNEWIAESVADERHRDLAAALVRVTTFVADHDALTADVAARQLRIGAWPGVRYLEGGWQWLVDALAARARRRGADLRTRAAVRSLERRGDGWVAATGDAEIEGDVVVVAAGLPSAAARLIEGIEAPGPAAEVSSLDVGLRRLPARTRFALGLDEPVYFSRHSPPKHRGGVLMTAASYAAEPLATLERLVDRLQPGWRDELVVHRHLPRMTAVGAVASPARRPPVAHEPGLFLAGDWVGSEGWLVDAALASGSAAARAALTAPRAVAA